MSKYKDLIAEITKKRDWHAAKVKELDAAIKTIMPFDMDEAVPVRARLVPPVPDEEDEEDEENSVAANTVRFAGPKKAGSREHIREIMKAQRVSKNLYPRSYYVDKAMKVPGVNEGHRASVETRVTNAIQFLKSAGDIAGYKTGSSNMSMVWGPSEAFDEEGTPMKPWRWVK